MDVLPLLIVISLAIIGLAVWLFFRMSDTGQFDDTEGPAHRILMDDDRPANKNGIDLNQASNGDKSI